MNSTGSYVGEPSPAAAPAVTFAKPVWSVAARPGRPPAPVSNRSAFRSRSSPACRLPLKSAATRAAGICVSESDRPMPPAVPESRSAASVATSSGSSRTSVAVSLTGPRPMPKVAASSFRLADTVTSSALFAAVPSVWMKKPSSRLKPRPMSSVKSRSSVAAPPRVIPSPSRPTSSSPSPIAICREPRIVIGRITRSRSPRSDHSAGRSLPVFVPPPGTSTTTPLPPGGGSAIKTVGVLLVGGFTT